jgi:hypothetical protein
MTQIMITNCPTCGAELGGRSVCARCGTLAGLELSLANLRVRAREFIDARLNALPRNFRPHHLLWVCAVMPIFIVPPLVGLIYAVRELRHRPDKGAIGLELLALIAVTNIILSVLVLYKFHLSPFEIISHVRSAFQTLMHLPSFLMPNQQRQLLHPTPI